MHIAQGFLTLHSVEDEQVMGAVNLLALLSNHPLRTLDAIHFGIARRLGAGRLATADAVMGGGVAQALGLERFFSIDRHCRVPRVLSRWLAACLDLDKPDGQG